MKTILVVEDDSGLQKYLKEFLNENDYIAQVAPDGVAAINTANKLEPDLVILDLGLPNISGEEVCRELRKRYPNLPIIILTAKDATPDIVHGLDLGADDYVTKPFSAEELLARIKARLRKQGDMDNRLLVADLELDPKTFEVKRNGQKIDLTPQEFKLLHYLMTNKGRILTREMILSRVWSYTQDVETRVVDVYMGYLRKKVDQNHKKKLLHSARGFGYMIKE